MARIRAGRKPRFDHEGQRFAQVTLFGTTALGEPAHASFDRIRELFSCLPESRMFGFGPGRFSFNVAGGRCEAFVIEHNLDVILHADHVIDLGPEGGADGGSIVAKGPPEEIARSAAWHTGKLIASALAGNSENID